MSGTLVRSLATVAFLFGSQAAMASTVEAGPSATLASFADEAQLQGYFETLIGERRRQQEAEDAARLAREAAWRVKREQDERALQAANERANARPGSRAARAAPPLPGGPGSLAGETTEAASVVVEHASTGARADIRADAGGRYRIESMPTGAYFVTSNGHTLTVGVSAGHTAKVSSVAETVTVMGAALSAIDAVSVESNTVFGDQGDAASAVLMSPGTVAGDAITNVQTVGVDEGGIVKKAGDFLIVLRRGRLFSIRVTDKALSPVSNANAFGPQDSGHGTWYDEMLVSGRTIVVVGYSYARGGTEVGLFDLAPDGRISYRSTYHLISNDYYSSRGYSSRLVGDTLVFYSPINLFGWKSLAPTLPGIRRWAKEDAAFRRIAAAEHVYRSGVAEDSLDQTLHTVTRCELGDGEMDCRSSSVIGPGGAAFYVSREAVYVWMVRYADDEPGDVRDGDEASVVRMPLDGSAPAALRVQGGPIDQMSFLERDGFLNVLVGSESKGLRMWSAEGKTGGLALFRVRLGDFGDAQAWSRPEHYRPLPSGPGHEGYWSLHNRYVGNWLLYGGEDTDDVAYALRIDGDAKPTELKLGHDVERIEAMGRDALFVGSAKQDLFLSSVGLGTEAGFVSRTVLPAAAQGDERSHGFFYRPLGERQGLFGLPIVEGDYGKRSASLQFLRNANMRLGRVGSLAASPVGLQDDAADGCVVSCVDWYGNARPIFIGDRIYGLLGYELVEGEMVDGRIRERRRVNFMPTPGAR